MHRTPFRPSILADDEMPRPGRGPWRPRTQRYRMLLTTTHEFPPAAVPSAPEPSRAGLGGRDW